MDYLLFDVFAVALPAGLLLLGAGPVRRLMGPAAALALLAILWTAPWDEHLVRTHVWSYDPAQVVGRIGAVPVEEYGFVALEVLLVGACLLRTGALAAAADAPPRSRSTKHAASARRRGARAWCLVTAGGLVLLMVGGHLRYLGLLLVWAAPPLALQRAVAGDVLVARVGDRLRTIVPVALWLCAVDRLALAHGIWVIAPDSAIGLRLLGLPVEEALFFGLTVTLAADGLLLAASPDVLRRVGLLLHRHHRAALGGPTGTGASSRRSGT